MAGTGAASSRGRSRLSKPLCLLDLDRTLLLDRTVNRLAERFGVRDRLEGVRAARPSEEPAAGSGESQRVAALFAGIPFSEFDGACRGAPLRPGAEAAVAALRGLGFEVGVVSASYRSATKDTAARLGLDFDVGVDVEVAGGRLTGRLLPSPFAGRCGRFLCKEEALRHHKTRLAAPFTVAVGDGSNDVCMMEAADYAVGVAPCHETVAEVADVVLEHLAELPRVVAAAWRNGAKVTP